MQDPFGGIKSKEIEKPETESGMSYWSTRTYRWVLPELDNQTKNIFFKKTIYKI